MPRSFRMRICRRHCSRWTASSHGRQSSAAARGAAGCSIADYPRKPRGGPFELDNEHYRRLSLCCRREGCRHRVTPESVRFLGRRVYISVVVLLCGVLLQGPTRWRADALRNAVGADRRTLERWRRWWVERSGTAARSRSVAQSSCRRPMPGRYRGRSWLASSARRASAWCTR